MALELRPNDNARTARPSILIFEGPAVGLLVLGVMFFIALYLLLSHAGLDWWPTVIISALPLLAITAFVHFVVNGKPPSYALDLFLAATWRLKMQMYRAGCMHTPPAFWAFGRKVRHPSEFNLEKV